VDAAARLEGGGVGAEAADGAFPHVGRGGLEDEVEVHVADQPGRLPQLRLELQRTPAGVADEQARAPRRRPLEQAAKERRRPREIQAVGHGHDVFALGRIAEQQAPALRLDRAAQPQLEPVVVRDRRIELDRLRRRSPRGAVEHEAPRPFVGVLAQQHDGVPEVGVCELRHRQQQRRRERRVTAVTHTLILTGDGREAQVAW
jgi:hypothetical protein